MAASKLSAAKARKILKHKSVKGKKLTKKQSKYMGMVAGGKQKPKKKMTESENMPHGMYVVTKESRGKIVTERKKAKYIKLK